MLIGAITALATVSGAPPLLMAVTALAVVHPPAFLGAATAWAVAARLRRPERRRPEVEARFLRGLAAELTAGASLRNALEVVADRTPELDLHRAVRLARTGRAATHIGPEIGRMLVLNGRTAAAAFRIADTAGGRTAAIMHGLADRAEDVGRLERERRALTAQARASAWLVGAVPLALALMMAVTGIGPGGASGSLGPGLIGVGIGLIGLGGAVVWWMVRRVAA